MNRALLAILLLGLGAGCAGEIKTLHDDRGAVIVGDGPQPRRDTGVSPRDAGGGFDLPTQAGDPCPSGSCAGEAICVAGLCRAKCVQPMPGCNDLSPDCPEGTACMGATSFTDACFVASGNTGDNCGNGTLCLPKHVCVRIGNNPARCLKLCKYQCDPGVQCTKTNNNCSVCSQ